MFLCKFWKHNFQQVHLKKISAFRTKYYILTCTLGEINYFMNSNKNLFSKKKFSQKTSDKIWTSFHQKFMFNFGRFSLLSVKRTFRIWDMKVRKKEYEFCLSFFAKKVFGKMFFIWIYKIIHFPNSTCQSVIFRSECWNFFEVDLLKFYFLKFTKKHCSIFAS